LNKSSTQFVKSFSNFLNLVVGFFYSPTIYRGCKYEEKTQKSRWKKTQKKTKQNIAVGKKSKGNPSGCRPAGHRQRSDF